MSCCAAGTESALDFEAAEHALPSGDELRIASRDLGNGLRQTDLSVPGVHCGACIVTLETALNRLEAVDHARVNLSSRRVSIIWKDSVQQTKTDAFQFVKTIADAGYDAHLFQSLPAAEDQVKNRLIRAVAVSGFASVNIMLLSVSVWSGADAATRDMFHWISAAIAAPAIVYAGRFFFQSAFHALRHGHTNMDVPISLAVTLSYMMSLYETWHHGDHAWFDASVTLLFFLLIGRTLDHIMRDKARAAITSLAGLTPRGAMVLGENGLREYRPLDEVKPGNLLMVAAGERIPVDCVVASGSSDMDYSIINGESLPVTVRPGEAVQAGVLNLTGPVTVKAMAEARDSFLSEVLSLMEAAEGGRARYRRIADRAARYYSPVVHLTALMSVAAWVVYNGDWNHALLVGISVLIITCPCALGLAVPVVQMVAAGRLFQQGIMVKDGSAMERLAEIDTVFFDKTGTLTMGRPRLVKRARNEPQFLEMAAALASHSRHPLSLALQGFAPVHMPAFQNLQEIPGSGLQAETDKGVWRLGNHAFACGRDVAARADNGLSQTVLSLNGSVVARFDFEDRLRPGVVQAIRDLGDDGYRMEILSGDRPAVVMALAARVNIPAFRAGLGPKDKADACAGAAGRGQKVFMIGDGINDAPALAQAHVSMAPSSASDIGRQAADFVFLHSGLEAVPFAIDVSKRAGRLIRENFALAIGYNLVAVPVAISGYATPLVAAVAMSTSSIIVVANALRLYRIKKANAAEARADAGSSLVVTT